LITDNPPGVFAFYLSILFPGLLLTYGFQSILKIDDISIDGENNEAC
jgi:hypothetical protein